MYLAILVSLRKYKHTELSQIAKINVKAQIYIFVFGFLHTNPRFLKLRIIAESVRVKKRGFTCKNPNTNIEIRTVTLIFAIDTISAVLNLFWQSRFFL